MPNYITINQKPIKQVSGIVVIKIYRYPMDKNFIQYKILDIFKAYKYRTIEERRKLVDMAIELFPNKFISIIPDENIKRHI